MNAAINVMLFEFDGLGAAGLGCMASVLTGSVTVSQMDVDSDLQKLPLCSN